MVVNPSLPGWPTLSLGRPRSRSQLCNSSVTFPPQPSSVGGPAQPYLQVDLYSLAITCGYQPLPVHYSLSVTAGFPAGPDKLNTLPGNSDQSPRTTARAPTLALYVFGCKIYAIPAYAPTICCALKPPPQVINIAALTSCVCVAAGSQQLNS